MTKIAAIALSSLKPAGDAVLTPQSETMLLTTDSQQWAFSARASFEVPGIAELPRGIRIGIEVERGVLGAGWVTADGTDWVTRTSAAAAPGLQELILELPAGTEGGGLVFDNWTRGDRPAKGVIHRIEIVEIAPVSGSMGVAARVQESTQRVAAGREAEVRGEREEAIRLYLEALALDSSNVRARIRLSALRVVPPAAQS